MRTAILILAFLIVRLTVFAQSSGENYIRIRQMTNESGSEYIESIRYYDGLGRHIQTVQCGVTPQHNDLVDYTCYDGAGRPITQFLPVVSNQNGNFVSLPQVKTFSEDTYYDYYAYTTTQYEQSDLGRVTNQFRPGSAWQSAAHSRKNFYDLNDTGVPSLNCIRYTVAESYTLTDTVMSVKNSGDFPTGSLYVLKSQDEDDHTVYTFTDSSDKTHLVRRVLDNNTFADTYYVYDLFDNLCAVLSPEASAKMKSSETTWNSSSPELSELSFLYIYDYLRHCIAKKLPGASWVLMVNDIGGRLVYSQDGVQRSRGEWSFILYDAFNRPCVNGICFNSMNVFDSEISYFVNHLCRDNTNDTFMGYNIYLNEFAQADGLVNRAPVNPIVLSVNYYDDYSFMGYFGFPEESSPLMAYEALDDYGTRYETSARTFLTGTMTALLDREYFSHSGGTADNSSPKYLHSVMYYNDHEECIQKIESNHLGGYDRYYSKYGFTGNLLKQRIVHTRNISSQSEGQSPDIELFEYETISDDVYDYYYDHALRLTDVTLFHNDYASVTLSSNQYNEIGQVETTSLLNGIHNIDYKYNIHGWVTEIDDNSTLRMNLYYESNPENPSKSYYNGNISACNWVANSDDIERFFVYSYDNLNRLVKSEYSEDTWRSSGIFDTEYTYDLNTNITSLKRNGLSEYFEEYEWETYFSTVDNLTYTYKDNKSNKVVKITDSGEDPVYYGAQNFVDGDDKEVEYTYDANGNLTSDLNKGITQITYNQIGLPRSVEFSDGHRTEYLYDASGRKLQTKYLLDNFKAIEGPVIGEIEFPGIGTLSNSQISAEDSGTSSGNSPPLNEWLPVDPGIDEPIVATRDNTIAKRDYCGDYIYLNDSLLRINTPIGYMAPDPVLAQENPDDYLNNFIHHAYVKDYQGNIRSVVNEYGDVVEINQFYPYGGALYDGYTTRPAKSSAQPYKYSGKEFDTNNGLNLYDFHARQHDPYAPHFTTIDPLAEINPGISPYVFCAGNPILYIDPTGLDWYRNNETSLYTWFDGNDEHEGYSYIGGKGSVLGEVEEYLNNVLTELYNLEGLYTEGFSMEIGSDNKKLFSLKNDDPNLLDDFIKGKGPEITIFLSDSKYTKELKEDKDIINFQNKLKAGNIEHLSDSYKFHPIMGPLKAKSKLKQFMGSYSYDGYIINNGDSIYNIVSDSKSCTSLFYHLPFVNNHRRSEQKKLGNTYQLYIWKSKK